MTLLNHLRRRYANGDPTALPLTQHWAALTLASVATGVVAIVIPLRLQPSSAEAWLGVLWVEWLVTMSWIAFGRPFSPASFGLGAAMLMYVIGPATAAVVNETTVIAGFDYTSGTVMALQICSAAQLGLLAGVGLATYVPRPVTPFVPVSFRVSAKSLTWASTSAGVIAAAALMLLTATSGADLSKYIAFGDRSSYGAYFNSSLDTQSGYLDSLTGVAGICLLLAVAGWSALTTGPKARALLALLGVIGALFLVSGGQRARFVVPMLATGLIWVKIRSGQRRVPLRAVTVCTVMALVLFSATVGVARGAGDRALTASNLFDAEYGQSSSLFAPLAGLAETVPSEQDYLWGQSYLDVAYFPIPRTLWAGKPNGSIVSLIGHFADVQTGVAFPEFGEMFANFGIVGVTLGSVLFGFALERLWLAFAAGTGRRGLITYPVAMAILLQLFTRGYAVGQFAGVLGFATGAVLCQRELRFTVGPKSGLPTQASLRGKHSGGASWSARS